MGEARRRKLADNDRQAVNDRRIERLIARQKRGKPISLGEIIPLCPYQTLFGVPPDTPPEVANRIVPDGVVAALGFVPEDFSDKMRADIVAELRAGKVIRLLSNRAELRDYAKREIALACGATAGSA